MTFNESGKITKITVGRRDGSHDREHGAGWAASSVCSTPSGRRCPFRKVARGRCLSGTSFSSGSVVSRPSERTPKSERGGCARVVKENGSRKRRRVSSEGYILYAQGEHPTARLHPYPSPRDLVALVVVPATVHLPVLPLHRRDKPPRALLRVDEPSPLMVVPYVQKMFRSSVSWKET